MIEQFGLGVIIQATDKASEVFGNVASSFGNMQNTIAGGTQAISKDMQTMGEIMTATVMGHALQNVGNNFIAKGKEMLGWVTEFTMGIIGVGDSVDKTRITLGALYKSAEAGQKKLDEIVQYALKTPFEIEQLTQIVTMFKAIGIEAVGMGSSVTSSKGKTSELLSIMSDLASLQPQIPFNMAAYAIKEYIAEGNTISMLRRMSLDVQNILGREMADTIEGRKKDIADLVEILGAEGLTDKLFGTWSQGMSNFRDFFFQLKAEIADAGMFQALKDTLTYVGELAQNLDPEVVKRFAKSVSDGFLAIYKPIDRVVRKVAEFMGTLIEYIGNNPWVAKLAFSLSVIAGGLTIVSGILLSVVGTVLVLTAGFRLVTSGLLAKQWAGVGLAIKSSLVFLAKFAVIAGLFYALWDMNFLGIQDKAKAFGKGLLEVYENITVGMDINGRALVLWVEKLRDSESAYDRFSAKVLDVITVVRGLFDVFSDGELSPDMDTALTDLGLMKFIEDAMEAKKNVELFFSGLETGFQNAKDKVVPNVELITEKFREFYNLMVDDILPMFGIYVEEEDKAMDSSKIVKKREEAEKLGETVGEVLAGLALLWAGVTVLSIIGAILKPVVSIVKAIGIGIGAIGTALGLSTGWVLLIIAVIVVVGILAIKFDVVRDAVKGVIAVVGFLLAAFVILLVGVATVIATIIAIIVSIVAVVGGVIRSVVELWRTGWKVARELVEGFVETIIAIFKFFITGNWEELMEELKGIWGEKWDNIKEHVDGFVKDFKETWGRVGTFLTGLWDGFYTPVSEFFTWVGEKFNWFLEKLGLAKSEMNALDNYNPKSAELIHKYNPPGSHIADRPPVKAPNKKTTSGSKTAYAVGTRFVPYDNLRAVLHKGEMVVPASENPYINSKGKILPFTPKASSTAEHYDMSVTFAPGSIVLNVQHATPEEAKKMADTIMKYIDRKKELEKIRKYKRGVS